MGINERVGAPSKRQNLHPDFKLFTVQVPAFAPIVAARESEEVAFLSQQSTKELLLDARGFATLFPRQRGPSHRVKRPFSPSTPLKAFSGSSEGAVL